jgi:hypothetical protein
MDVRVFEHGIGLVRILLPFQSGIKILLVSEVDFVVSFVHLECAPFGCSGYMQYPIITNNEAHSRVVSHFLANNHAGLGTRSPSFAWGPPTGTAVFADWSGETTPQSGTGSSDRCESWLGFRFVTDAPRIVGV